jgi:NDP-sugar pyrophosphorylase family protein
VTLVDTGQETMTGGRVRRIRRHIDGDTFMVTYGDGVADVDIGALLNYHRTHGRLATVTAMQPPSRFGMLKIGEEGHVTRFVEKPQMDGWASAGFVVFNRRGSKSLCFKWLSYRSPAAARSSWRGTFVKPLAAVPQPARAETAPPGNPSRSGDRVSVVLAGNRSRGATPE